MDCTDELSLSTTADQKDTQSGIRIVEEKVRTLICFAREMYGVTIGKVAAQIISRTRRGTEGMTGYRRANGRSRTPRRYVLWSEKVLYLEQSKTNVQVEAKWHEGDNNEECRARIVRNMTADDNLNQRVQISQDQIVETSPSEVRTGERDPAPDPARRSDSRSELKNKYIWCRCHTFTECQQQFEQVKQQVQFGSQQQSNRNSTINAGGRKQSGSVKDRKLLTVLMWNWKGLSLIQSGIDFNYSLTDFLMQVKKDADVYVDRIFSDDRRKRENVKKDMIQVGVHPSA